MSACPFQSLVAAHFGGGNSPSGERRLRAHLPECAACRDWYQRQLVLASLDPKALPWEERLARGIGLRARRTFAAPVMATLAVAAVALILWARPSEEGGFVARGRGKSAEPGVRIFRVSDKSVPVAGSIGRGDELAFAYRNVGKRKRLLVFGVDEHQHVYWYHPAWTDAAANPVAVPIEPGAEWRELREAIAHPLDGAELRVHALFTDEPVAVRTVEARLHRGEPAAADGEELVVPLRVTR